MDAKNSQSTVVEEKKKPPETRNRTERNAYIHLMAGHRQLDGTLAASSASVSSARRRRCSSPEFVIGKR